MEQQLSVSRVAYLGAKVIFTAFEDYQTAFRAITRRAQARFRDRAWFAARADAVERLDLYRTVVDRTVSEIQALLGSRVEQKLVWASMKAVYSGLITGCRQWELAETFLNSITRRIFATVGVDPEIEFVDSDFDAPPTPAGPPVYRVYPAQPSLSALLAAILADVPWQAPYQDMAGDACRGAELVAGHLGLSGMRNEALGAGITGAEIITSVFYRGSAAYLIGRLLCGEHWSPLVLSLRHPAGGVVLDAVLLAENDVSILFSFAHSYFHVDTDRPYDLVHYLKLILPRKRIAELYIALGFNKQGKTELYRDLLHHLAHARDQFDRAPGARGMVMLVFTMPSYDVVFKIIKDRFQRPKTTTRAAVMDKYRLVYRHDRAGRLLDAQEFEHLRFPRALFRDELVEELCRDAGRTVTLEGDDVHIQHCYVERRVVPLNLYVHQGGEAAVAAVLDYGRCIKDLMAVNIFPGDLLLKNFGVTGNGRVVFYDYDEVGLLTDCNFRELPAGRSEEEELADQLWQSVGENDVFPGEFARFLGLYDELHEVFVHAHGDLLQAHVWRSVQDRLRAGEMMFIIPYDETRRLRPGTPAGSAFGQS